MPKVLNPNESYTFSRYFELPYAPADILADLGCTLERTNEENLPYFEAELDWLPALAEGMRRRLKRVNTTTEQARREALIFPLIDPICDRLDCPINIEYTVSVSNWLKGTLDYYIPSPRNLLIIEAKQSDLTKGFTQLAVELIALARWVKVRVQSCTVRFQRGKFGGLAATTERRIELSNICPYILFRRSWSL